MSDSLSGQRVIVTGGASGIGAQYAAAFAQGGAKVLIADIDIDGAQATASALSEQGHHVVATKTDVSDTQSTGAMAQTATDQFGGVDVLVNNAAMYQSIGTKKPLTEISVEEWDRVMAINVRGVWLCMKAVAPIMKAQGGGRIVNISSSVVHAGVPWFLHYTASKAAVIGMTRAAARELGPDGITVNSVAPGLVDNDASAIINTREYIDSAPKARALQRGLAASDMVGAVLFLSSPASQAISGQTIIVDGGQMML